MRTAGAQLPAPLPAGTRNAAVGTGGLRGLQLRIHKIVATELGIRDLGVEDDLVQDHGRDELDLMGIAMRLEEEFDLRVQSIPEEELVSDSTVDHCVALVSEAMGKTSRLP